MTGDPTTAPTGRTERDGNPVGLPAPAPGSRGAHASPRRGRAGPDARRPAHLRPDRRPVRPESRWPSRGRARPGCVRLAARRGRRRARRPARLGPAGVRAAAPGTDGRKGDVRRRPAPDAEALVPGDGRPQQRRDDGAALEGEDRHRAVRERLGDDPLLLPRRHRLPRLVRRHPVLAPDSGVRHRGPPARLPHGSPEPEDQDGSATGRARDEADGRGHHRVAPEHRAREEPRADPRGDRAPLRLHEADLRPRDGEGEEGAGPRVPAGDDHQRPPAVDPLHPALAHLPQGPLARRAHRLPVHPQHDLRTPPAARERPPEPPRGGSLASGVRAADGDADRAATGGPRRRRRDREPPLRGRLLPLPGSGGGRARPHQLRREAGRHDRLRRPLGLRQVDVS